MSRFGLRRQMGSNRPGAAERMLLTSLWRTATAEIAANSGVPPCSEGGAESWSILASLATTAKLNGVDPQTYLTDVLERIVSGRIHEAVRDLARARETAMRDLKVKRQQLLFFLLRHGRSFPDGKNWTKMHARWLTAQKFTHPAQQIVFQDQIEAINAARARLTTLEQQLRDIVPTWTMAPVVAAYQALRGVSFLVAATFVAEVGDVRRFTTPQQLMAFLGLVPSERTTGDTVRRGAITKTGNGRARRVLVEAAWTYRHSARVSQRLQDRLKGLPVAVRTIAWKAPVRLCARYRRLIANGKKPAVATTAIAREIAAFLWAIGHQIEPQAL
jgi:transposase